MQYFWQWFSDRARKLALFLFAGYIVFALAACSQPSTSPASATSTPGASNTATPTTQPSATTLPSGTLLYQANWSRRLADWQHGEGWSIAQGQLQVNNPAHTSITLPYTPVVPDYAIELHVLMVKVLQIPENWFYMMVDKTATKDGFQAGYGALTAPQATRPDPNYYAGFAQASADQLDVNAGFTEIDYVPGLKWRMYRVEVQGNQVTLFIDGRQVSRSTSLKDAFANGPLRLDCRGLQLSISSLRITAL